MPVLPLVDLLILLGSGSLATGFVLKAVALATFYHPSILGFTSLDFVVIAGVCFGLAIMLVARTWLKLNEPQLLALQSRLRSEEAQRRAVALEHAMNDATGATGAAPLGRSPADRASG